MSDKIRYAKYTEGIAPDGPAILKDGHTMFQQDIVADLNRKSYLEKEYKRLQKNYHSLASHHNECCTCLDIY